MTFPSFFTSIKKNQIWYPRGQIVTSNFCFSITFWFFNLKLFNPFVPGAGGTDLAYAPGCFWEVTLAPVVHSKCLRAYAYAPGRQCLCDDNKYAQVPGWPLYLWVGLWDFLPTPTPTNLNVNDSNIMQIPMKLQEQCIGNNQNSCSCRPAHV